MSVLAILLGFMPAIGLAAAFWRLTQTQKNGNGFLAGLILVSTLSLTGVFLRLQPAVSGAQAFLLDGLATLVLFVYGPLLYCYTSYLFLGKAAFGPGWLHFLPKVGQLLLYAMAFVLQQEWISFRLIEALAIAHVGVYTGLSMYILKTHSEPMPESTGKFWYPAHLHSMLLLKLACLVLWSALYLYRMILPTSVVVQYGYLLIWLIPTLVIYVLGYHAIVHPELFRVIQQITRYKRSTLTGSDSERLFAELTRVMQEKQPHLDPSLTLASLAELVQTTPHFLSRVINEHAHKNFFDFVNTYRIEAFRTLAADPKNRRFTLLALALQAGFNSKSTFNSAFKRLVDATPTEYVKLTQGSLNGVKQNSAE